VKGASLSADGVEDVTGCILYNLNNGVGSVFKDEFRQPAEHFAVNGYGYFL